MSLSVLDVLQKSTPSLGVTDTARRGYYAPTSSTTRNNMLASVVGGLHRHPEKKTSHVRLKKTTNICIHKNSVSVRNRPPAKVQLWFGGAGIAIIPSIPRLFHHSVSRVSICHHACADVPTYFHRCVRNENKFFPVGTRSRLTYLLTVESEKENCTREGIRV